MIRRLTDFGTRQPLAISMVIVGMLLALYFGVFTPMYETNDDPQMSLTVAGDGIAVPPDEHMVYTNVLIGLVLKNLYLQQPNVPWYGIYLLLVHYIAHSGLLYALVRRQFQWRAVAGYAVYFMVVGVYFLNNLQFTTTAFLATQTGIMLALTALWNESSLLSRGTFVLCSTSALLLWLGSLVRLQSCYLALVLAAPLAAATLLSRYSLSMYMRTGLIGSQFLALLFLSDIYNTRCYQADPIWREYMKINEPVNEFVNYKPVKYSPSTKPAFDRVGWSENDFELLMHYCYLDSNVYSAQKLNDVLIQTREYPEQKLSMWIVSAVILLGKMLAKPVLLAATLAFCAVWLQPELARTDRLILLATFVAGIAVMCALFLIKQKLPDRVAYPIMAFPLVGTLALVACRPSSIIQRASPSSLRFLRKAVFAGLAMSTVWSGFIQYEGNQHDLQTQSNYRADVANLRPRRDQLYVCDTFFRCDSVPALRLFEARSDFRRVYVGPTQCSTMYYSALQDFGIDDLYRALAERDDVLFITLTGMTPLIQTYLREHHDLETQAEIVFQGQTFSVTKLNTVSTDFLSPKKPQAGNRPSVRDSTSKGRS